ncbi:hypothetical protein DYBT9623_03201 [Dyadobacter sp. CECT 9623]|uniref:DUF3179 domain-containing protein n=1 Tax=Dyadobacter linearis TaxID=2823330 RepID=A0ABM8USH1_9BACT|nr:DUF3179 domain-containing (seleno)protein [Dyadobacter sp. CECT 9623]CAG5070656.1 hypothetical protein DYBT9623_03201 [Dyadobacter sp. CECT 9623]
MKKIFYIGIVGILLYEIAKVYFIMPMPGSQRMNSIDAAYFLHTWRWAFRIVFWAMILVGSVSVYRGKTKWLPGLLLLLIAAITYATNYEMAADTMFYQPQTVLMQHAAANKIDPERLVIGAEVNGEAKAYPIQFIGYHHQVRDTLGGKPIMVTYCTVCRTGRVFEPVVDGKVDNFRLVGMDHFNAMFEDEMTGSWWRQANGEAIAGPLKGKTLPELAISQTSLGQWLKLHPQSRIMQPDPVYQAKYDSMSRYESGKNKSLLTRADSLPWKEKSWVVGVQTKDGSKAFDWRRLGKEKVINDQVGSVPVFLVIAGDKKSFFAFERPDMQERYSIRNDTIFGKNGNYDLLGKRLDGLGQNLARINAYQEYWHSWRTFHPETKQY